MENREEKIKLSIAYDLHAFSVGFFVLFFQCEVFCGLLGFFVFFLRFYLRECKASERDTRQDKPGRGTEEEGEVCSSKVIRVKSLLAGKKRSRNWNAQGHLSSFRGRQSSPGGISFWAGGS